MAVAKHGSLQDLEEEKQRRMQGKLEQRMQKRQAAEQEEDRQRRLEAQLQATLDKYTSASQTPTTTTDNTNLEGQAYGELHLAVRRLFHGLCVDVLPRGSAPSCSSGMPGWGLLAQLHSVMVQAGLASLADEHGLCQDKVGVAACMFCPSGTSSGRKRKKKQEPVEVLDGADLEGVHVEEF